MQNPDTSLGNTAVAGYWPRLCLAVGLLSLIAAGAVVHGQQRQRPIEFYWDRPTHCDGRPFAISGAWKSPNEGGATIWTCR